MTLAPKPLQATLRKITETLAHELARPSRLAPAWSDFEWTVARAVVSMHGVSPLLAGALHWRGPDAWIDFLTQQRVHTAARHGRISALLRRIDEDAREQGLAAMALKGAALHAIGVYSPGERPMADIDLLVKPRDTQRMGRLLESLGYRAAVAGWKEQVFTPIDAHTCENLGEHSNNDIKIELHHRISERLPWHITDLSERVFPERLRPGLNDYSSLTALMIHLLVHAAGAMAFQGLRLLHLHDIASLAIRMTGADWDALLGEGADHERLWWAFPPLRLTSVYFSAAIPQDVMTALERVCPWLLVHTLHRKTLSDVSYSHLRIDAFPGIEWARSVAEAAQYAASRVLPSAEHLAFREEAANTQAWASGTQWQKMSQGRRMVRWVLSRPVRPVTMHSVNAAIAQGR
jgi:hypothetical protein